MDQLPQCDVATAYIAVEVYAFDKWWAAGKFWVCFFCQRRNM